MLASRRLAPAVVVSVLSVGFTAVPHAHAAGTASTTYVGGAGYGDGGPAIDARLTFVSPGGQVTTDPQGRVVFADPAANEIRRIDADGTIERIAGNGDHAGTGSAHNGEGAGFSGDGGPATSAALSAPTGVQIASDGTMYIADSGNARIRKVGADGTITTIAGTGTPGTSATTQPASTAAVEPTRLRLASNGDLYFTETAVNVADVRKIDADGNVSLVAGNVAANTPSSDQSPCATDQSVAIGHCFSNVNDVAVADDGTIYLADSAVVYQVSSNTLTRLSGAYQNYSNTGDGGAASSATLAGAYALALDASGHVLVETGGEIRSITPGGTIDEERPLAPSLTGTSMSFSGTDLLVLTTTLVSVASDGVVTTLAGTAANGTGDGLPAADAVFTHIVGVAATADGGTLVGDGVGRVWKVDAAGVAHRVAGSLGGQTAYTGEGGPATDAVLPGVSSVAAAPDGSFYVGTADGAVRHVDLGGTITTVAGTGTLGNGADGTAPATTVAIGHPYAMTATAAGTLYILDSDNNRLRALSGGNLTTVAGTGSALGRAAVGQPMSALNLHGVTGLAGASDGSLRLTTAPNGDTPWLFDVSSTGTVTNAQRTSLAVPAVDASGDTLVGAGYGVVREFADGGEEQLTSYDDDAGAEPPVMGLGGDGDVWWTRDSFPGLVGQRLWKLAEPAPAARPAAITGTAFHWDSNGAYVSWNAPAAGEKVVPILRHGANAVAANPFDGFDLTYYVHSAIANTASVVFGESTDPIVQGDPFTISLFPETSDGVVIGPPTVTTFLLVAPTACVVKAGARTVLYGKSVALTGTLTSLGSAVAGRATTMSSQAVGRSSVVIKSAATSSTGTLVASQVPAANTTYTFRHAVDKAYAACAASVAVTVQPKITAALAAATIRRSTHTTLTATVGPNLDGQYVTLQHLVGTSWRTISSLKLNRYSKAAWAVGSTVAGTFHYRVVKAADKYHAASISPSIALKVT